MSTQLESGEIPGRIPDFVKWWNEQNTFKFNGGTRIIYLNEKLEYSTCDGFEVWTVEYVLQNK